MDFLLLTLLTGLGVALFVLGRVFKDPVLDEFAGVVFIVVGALILGSGVGQSVSISATVNSTTNNATGNLTQTQNTTSTETNTWAIPSAQGQAVGLLYLLFGLYIVLAFTIESYRQGEEAIMRRFPGFMVRWRR